MSKKSNDALQKADDYIMGLCTPKAMSPEEAIDFLESVIDRCRGAVEALREENDLD